MTDLSQAGRQSAIRRGAAARVSSLFFLVPPCTAAIARAMFGEPFGPVEPAGLAVATLGVARW